MVTELLDAKLVTQVQRLESSLVLMNLSWANNDARLLREGDLVDSNNYCQLAIELNS